MIPNSQKGFVNIIVMVLIAILLVTYLGVDLQQAFSAPQQAFSTVLLVKNMEFTWSMVTGAVTTYIYNPAMQFFGKSGSNLLPAGNTSAGGTIVN